MVDIAYNLQGDCTTYISGTSGTSTPTYFFRSMKKYSIRDNRGVQV